jgi:membrane-associated phospholipid phosphatase
VPRSTAIRAAACTVLAAGLAAPLLRRRLRLKPPVVIGAAAATPFALAAFPRSRARDVGMCVLQMYAYVVTYKMPNDDPDKLMARVRVEYPVKADRFIGRGTTPTLRLQRALSSPERFARWEKVLVWSHWVWFAFPHGTVAYTLLRHRDQFPAAAARIYATFDLGVIGYWAIPTAPPWFAAQRGLMEDGRTPELRRMMVEYGEQFWKQGWAPLYGVLGGNPLAAMPSLHFATSVTAAHVLSDTGRVAGAFGWAYAATLGIALVYLGEHYVVDLAAGLALAETIQAAQPRLEPVSRGLTKLLQVIEAKAQGRV